MVCKKEMELAAFIDVYAKKEVNKVKLSMSKGFCLL